MKRGTKLALIIAAGVPAGMAYQAFYAPQPDRVAAAMDLFERYCLPLASGTRVTPDGARQFMQRAAEPVWDVAGVHLTLDLGPHGCSVSDTMRPLNAPERDRLLEGLATLVEARLPLLHLDAAADGHQWDAFHFWGEHPATDPRHWGVFYTRWEAVGHHAFTTLRLVLPTPSGTEA